MSITIITRGEERYGSSTHMCHRVPHRGCGVVLMLSVTSASPDTPPTMPSSTKRQVIDWIDQQPWTRPKQTIEIDARDLVGEDWYTNPHGNETPGRHYETFRQAKQISTSEYHRPTITVYLRYPEGVERVREDKWTEMDIGRRIAGCLTDLEVMTRMDMIRVKVLLDPAGASEYTPEGGISSTPFNGVQADVGAILRQVLNHWST